jgi:hypothetical protein
MNNNQYFLFCGLLVSIGVFFGLMLGAGLATNDMEEKQHTEKAGCEYVEQAPCKIIYIKDDK